MITRNDVKALIDEGSYEEARDSILEARAAFTRSGGPAFIRDFLTSAGLFSKLDPNDPAQIGAYNHAIELADRIGLFSEASIGSMISSLMGLDPFTGEQIRT